MQLLQPTEGTQFPTTREMATRAFNYLAPKPFNTLVFYEEFWEVMGLNPAADNRARAAVLRAARLLLRDHNKKLINVRMKGYRIVNPNEHVEVSSSEQARARRWLKRSLETVTHVALDALTPTEVARLVTEQARAALQVAFSRRLIRQKALPARGDLELPPTPKLLEMMRKKPKKE